MLWMVSASKATLPDILTTTICNAAVITSSTNDHLIAHTPFRVVAMEASTTPWACPWRLP
jgi:hypothetical protein